MVPNISVVILLCIIEVCSNLAFVYGSRSEEKYQRGEIMDDRQILKPLVKPVMVKRGTMMQSKGYATATSKSNQPLKYVRIPVEEGARTEYSRKVPYLKTRGGPVPVYQVRTLPKTLPRQPHPKVVYVVQPRPNELPHQVLYHENSPYPEVSGNYLSDVSPNRIPIGYKQMQGPYGNEDLVGSYSQYGGVDYPPHQELLLPFAYREPIGNENGVIYSDVPLSSVRNIPELTGNELYNYPKY